MVDSSCTLQDTYLAWHKGEPIGERFNVNTSECKKACTETEGCAAWTLNTRNGWCGLKSTKQIKPTPKTGFESGILDGNSPFCG